MFRLPRSLGPQIAPTGADLHPRGSRAVYTTQPPGWLPAPGRGIASHPIRATDAAGLSPAELQPCRLLPNPVTPTIDFLVRSGHMGKVYTGMICNLSVGKLIVPDRCVTYVSVRSSFIFLPSQAFWGHAEIGSGVQFRREKITRDFGCPWSQRTTHTSSPTIKSHFGTVVRHPY